MNDKSEKSGPQAVEAENDDHSETQNLKVVKTPLEIEVTEGFDPYDTASLHVRKVGTD